MTQDLIDAKINSYATRCFLETADRDYVHARLAYRCMLSPQFRWSALHALEKYGKCILLLNRIDGKTIGHEVMEAVAKVKDARRFEIQLSADSKNFIARLENNAADRYLQFSWYTLPGELQLLDRAVVEIRRYCQVLDYEIQKPNGEKTNLFHLCLERVTLKQDQVLANVPIIGGWLERILAKPQHPAREALLWDNAFFGSPIENEKAVWDYSESEVSPFELHPEVITELKKWIRMSKSFKQFASHTP